MAKEQELVFVDEQELVFEDEQDQKLVFADEQEQELVFADEQLEPLEPVAGESGLSLEIPDTTQETLDIPQSEGQITRDVSKDVVFGDDPETKRLALEGNPEFQFVQDLQDRGVPFEKAQFILQKGKLGVEPTNLGFAVAAGVVTGGLSAGAFGGIRGGLASAITDPLVFEATEEAIRVHPLAGIATAIITGHYTDKAANGILKLSGSGLKNLFSKIKKSTIKNVIDGVDKDVVSALSKLKDEIPSEELNLAIEKAKGTLKQNAVDTVVNEPKIKDNIVHGNILGKNVIPIKPNPDNIKIDKETVDLFNEIRNDVSIKELTSDPKLIDDRVVFTLSSEKLKLKEHIKITKGRLSKIKSIENRQLQSVLKDLESVRKTGKGKTKFNISKKQKELISTFDQEELLLTQAQSKLDNINISKIEVQKRVNTAIKNINTNVETKIDGSLSNILNTKIKLRDIVAKEIVDNPDIVINANILKKLNNMKIGSMTTSDLDELGNIVKQINHVKLRSNTMLTTGAKVHEVINEITDKIGRPPVIKDPIVGSLTPEFKALEPIRVVNHMRQDNIFKWLDGLDEQGPNTVHLNNTIEKSTNNWITEMLDNEDVIQVWKKEFNILDNVNTSLREAEVQGKITNITPNNGMAAYISTFDPEKLKALKLGRNLTDKDIVNMTNVLTDNEKQYVERIATEYWGKQYEGVAKVFHNITGETLPKIKGYSEIVTDRDISKYIGRPNKPDNSFDTAIEIKEEILDRNKFSKIQTEADFTKERKNGAPVMSLDFHGDLYNNIKRTSHYKNMAESIRDVEKIITSDDWKKAVTNKAGEKVVKVTKNWLSDIAFQNSYIDSPSSTVLRTLRHHTSIGMLGANLISGMKQTLSYFPAIAFTSKGSIIGGLHQVIKDPKNIEEFVVSRSPQQRLRFRTNALKRELSEVGEKAGIKLFNKPGFKKVKKVSDLLSDKVMEHLSWFDKKTVLSVWKGSYDDFIVRNSNKLDPSNLEKQAILFADEIIKKTQPNFQIKDLPAFFRGGELEKILSTFARMPNQTWNLFQTDIVGKLQKGKISKTEAAKRFWWIWTLPALIGGEIDRGGSTLVGGENSLLASDNPAKEIVKDLLSYSPASGIPYAKPFIQGAVNGYDWNVPVIAPINEVVRGMTSTKPETRNKHIIKAIGFGAKLPVTQLGITSSGLIEYLNKETDDIRRIFFSETRIGEKSQPPGLIDNILSDKKKRPISRTSRTRGGR